MLEALGTGSQGAPSLMRWQESGFSSSPKCLAMIWAVWVALVMLEQNTSHLNTYRIESNMSVPGIVGHPEIALIQSFEMSPHLISL